MRKILFCAIPILLALAGCSGGDTSALHKTPDIKLPALTGFAAIGPNPQGYEEYRHEQTGMVFVLIPAGTFSMGSNDGKDDEKPVYEVALDSFLIAKYEVTQEQWQKIMGNNPAKFKGGNNPVEQISWDDCREFCWKTGLRLPTEAEWEYAARAGTTTKYYWGNEPDGNYMWYGEKWESGHQPVGQKQPNGFGLYDMSGNVWEWCADWYGAYNRGSQNNPTGPGSGQARVVRGGSWNVNAFNTRSANRFRYYPSYRNVRIGFRCVAPVK